MPASLTVKTVPFSCLAEMDRDLAPVRRVLHGVAQQIVQDLFEAPSITTDQERPRRSLNGHLVALACGLGVTQLTSGTRSTDVSLSSSSAILERRMCVSTGLHR